jgi:hypothetical protein
MNRTGIALYTDGSSMNYTSFGSHVNLWRSA